MKNRNSVPFQKTDFAQIEFEKTFLDGRSIIGNLMNQGIRAKNNRHPQRSDLVCEIEEVFFFLVDKAEAKIGGERLDRVIEAPDKSGVTVFISASKWSEKIAVWILEREIEVAFVDHKWMTPQFIFPNSVEKMALKGINPFVVRYDEKSEYSSRPSKFINIDKEVLTRFLIGEMSNEKTAAFYSFVDSNCGTDCAANCGDKMRAFKLYTGAKKIENEKSGGEGTVGFGKWHAEVAAFKKIKMEKFDAVSDTSEMILSAEKTRAEFEAASKLSGANIVKVFHLFRYQETEKFNGRRFTENWTVIVMEKHSKNIGELTPEERKQMKALLRDASGRVFNKIHQFKINTCTISPCLPRLNF